ncbi:MAG: winged helix-turn-helix domain-containing protein [Methanothrix sp.]|nr:winged helix-turn-helix domain-containing protein [Methanothrix sp.]
MPPRRSKDQIMTQILDLCQGDGAGKTRIVYQVNLNFNTVNIHLDLLQKKELLEAGQGDRPIYRTTPKGEQALESLRKIEAIYS